MLRPLALSQHKHTGKIIPNHHTSYIPLVALLAVVGVVLSLYTSELTFAAHPGPIAGSVSVTGTMPGPPPSTAPTITSPINGQHFSTTPITVSGTCPPNTLVELYKTDIFAGSTFCSSDATYTLKIDLLYGKNDLKATAYDALDQSSPSSAIVTVYYDAQPSLSQGIASLDFGGAQLLLNTDAVYRGLYPNNAMAFPLTVLGGRAPYAISIQWGDGTTSLVPRGDNTTFTTPHTYKKAGVFIISVQATDASGRVAFISVAAIVNGQPDPVAVVSTSSSTPSPILLLALWPLYVSLIAIVLSFWLGERREKHILEVHGQLIDQVRPIR